MLEPYIYECCQCYLVVGALDPSLFVFCAYSHLSESVVCRMKIAASGVPNFFPVGQYLVDCSY